MPRKKKSKRVDLENSNPSFDLSLDDYANSENCTNRLKKAVLKPIGRSIESSVNEQEVIDLPWFEEENWIKVRRYKKKNVSVDCQSVENGTSGFDYPLDFWFILSNYIAPEDVLRFSLICKSALQVVCSSSFWYSLYKRLYKPSYNLPSRLQHHSMDRLFGLRPAVIRYLYYTYPPFMEIAHRKSTMGCEMQCLVGLKCISMWCKRVKQHWQFYLKFQEFSHNLCCFDDDNYPVINDNPEHGCRILRISCINFIPHQSVMGYYLQEATSYLSPSMCHQIIKLNFNTNYSRKNRKLNSDGLLVLVFDPVVHQEILEWWFPDYPAYNDNKIDEEDCNLEEEW